jgi:hypothetical protein
MLSKAIKCRPAVTIRDKAAVQGLFQPPHTLLFTYNRFTPNPAATELSGAVVLWQSETMIA